MTASRIAAIARSVLSQFWGIALLLALWQLWVLTATPNSLIVVPPLAVLKDVLAEPATYLNAALWTVGQALAGLASGLILGLALAILAWSSSAISGFLSPAALVISSTPVVCLIPLLARLFGYQPSTEFATVTIMMFFPGFVFAGTGLRTLPPLSASLLDTWDTPPLRRLTLLALPAAIPSLATALRTGAAASILVAVVAEYLMQTGGLGTLIATAMQQFDIPRAFGASILAMLLSTTLYTAATSLERRLQSDRI